MKRIKNFSTRTSVLILAAVLLLAAGTVTGARAAFIAQGDLYRATFYVNQLGVHLIENGDDVCDGQNTVDGKTKVTGELLGAYKTKDADGNDVLGSLDPGKTYSEVIQAENGKDVEQYVRLTVRKYWLKEENGKTVKATDLSPALIKLNYGDSDYNSTDWVLGESSTESATYYYRTTLAGNTRTEPLFDRLSIDKAVIPDMHMPTEKELKSEAYAPYVTTTTTETNEGKTVVYTYSYTYDGYTFYIEADVQALQTHNAQDAIHSAWGVYNIKVNSDGSLSVQ